MANGYNPYIISGSQTGLMENLLQKQQSELRSDLAISQHKTDMVTDFEKEQIRKQREFEELQAKKRKKNPLEKALPLLQIAFPGMAPIIGALGAGAGMKKDVDFEKRKLADMKGIGIGSTSKYGDTFLGSKARGLESEAHSTIDSLLREGEGIGTGNILSSAIGGALSGSALGSIGKDLGHALEPGLGITEIVKDGEIVGEQNVFDRVFEQLKGGAGLDELIGDDESGGYNKLLYILNSFINQ